MESLSHAKRLASFEIPDNEFVNGSSHKRCKQLVTSQVYVWHGRQLNKAQLSTSLRRVQSAPIGREARHLETCSDLEHWRSREVEKHLCPDRMTVIQAEVTLSMRTTLVDWLGEVRDEFRLHSETLFLAVAYLDSFLVIKPVSRGRFQLLGLACVWVAAKFQEVHPPSLGCMLAMAEHMYSSDDLKAMEKEVLFTLDFGLAVPTSLRFLHYLLQLSPLPDHPLAATSARRLAEALLELTLLDTAFLRVLPSQVASVAVYLSLGLLRHHEGLPEVMELSATEPDTLGFLVKRLSETLHEAAAQPHPCALLLRFRAWEALHGRQATTLPTVTAAAPAVSAGPPSTPAATYPELISATSAPRPAQLAAPSALPVAAHSGCGTGLQHHFALVHQRSSCSQLPSAVAAPVTAATAAAAAATAARTDAMRPKGYSTAHCHTLQASKAHSDASAAVPVRQQHLQQQQQPQQPTEPICPVKSETAVSVGVSSKAPMSEAGSGTTGAGQEYRCTSLDLRGALGSLNITSTNAAAAAGSVMACC